MDSKIKDIINTAPSGPGVYIFYAADGVKMVPLYIGKAANLKNRLRSYLKPIDFKNQALQREATYLEIKILNSEIAALIEESRLIKRLKPKYNVIWRDDKSYLYVAFTQEKFPRILITHQKPRVSGVGKIKTLIGPFTDGSALRLVLKLLRRHFPYCTCMQKHLRLCINTQINKCLGFCCQKNSQPSAEELEKYRRHIKAVQAVLRGSNKKILNSLTDTKEIQAIKKIFEHREYLNVPASQPQSLSKRRENFPDALLDLKKISKIECYDNSNLAGKEAVGALTVLIKHNNTWVPDKNQWRKFKIKSAPTRDDPRMIHEVVSRRLKHLEWPLPDLIIIDGGLIQFRNAQKALSESGYLNNPTRLISFAKPHRLIFGLTAQAIPLTSLSPEFQKLIEQAIYLTHNFVIRYHRSVRRKLFLEQ